MADPCERKTHEFSTGDENKFSFRRRPSSTGNQDLSRDAEIKIYYVALQSTGRDSREGKRARSLFKDRRGDDNVDASEF